MKGNDFGKFSSKCPSTEFFFPRKECFSNGFLFDWCFSIFQYIQEIAIVSEFVGFLTLNQDGPGQIKKRSQVIGHQSQWFRKGIPLQNPPLTQVYTPKVSHRIEPENDGFQRRDLLESRVSFSGSMLNFRGVGTILICPDGLNQWSTIESRFPPLRIFTILIYLSEATLLTCFCLW